MSEINFKATFTTLSLYIACQLCTHQCECVGTKNSSFTEEQVSRNLRIRATENGLSGEKSPSEHTR